VLPPTVLHNTILLLKEMFGFSEVACGLGGEGDKSSKEEKGEGRRREGGSLACCLLLSENLHVASSWGVTIVTATLKQPPDQWTASRVHSHAFTEPPQLFLDEIWKSNRIGNLVISGS
jgi:hypothetical protein